MHQGETESEEFVVIVLSHVAGVACIEPPVPPNETHLIRNYTGGTVVPFGDGIQIDRKSSQTYFCSRSVVDLRVKVNNVSKFGHVPSATYENLRSTNPALSPITRASPAITSARRVSNFSKLSSKSLLALCNLNDLLKSILKILLRWILLNEHVPTFLTVLMENLFKKDFEKVFQNFNRIAKVKNMF